MYTSMPSLPYLLTTKLQPKLQSVCMPSRNYIPKAKLYNPSLPFPLPFRSPPPSPHQGSTKIPQKPYPILQSIHKLRIFPIRQIQPLLVLQFPVFRPRSHRRLLLVLAPTIPPYEHQIDETCAPAADDGDFGGYVARGVFGAESLGAWELECS